MCILFSREFVSSSKNKTGGNNNPFFLYVGFGDTHRCKLGSTIGTFCEYFGSGGEHGVIEDWKPKFFHKDEIVVPKFLPDNELVRDDLSRFYTAVNRMDQGVGLILNELKTAGLEDNTLIVFFSDNGLPFPSGKTNLFTKQGQGEPLIIVNPLSKDIPSHRSNKIVSSLVRHFLFFIHLQLYVYVAIYVKFSNIYHNFKNKNKNRTLFQLY